MLQLQRFKADSEELTKLLTDSEMRIKSIALVHEKLYESEQLSRIDFRSYINGLVASIKNMYDPIGKGHVETACDTVPLNVNQAVPLGAQFKIKGNNGTDIRLSFSQKDVRGSSSAMPN